MKKSKSQMLFASLLALFLTTTSCEEGFEDVTTDEQQTIEAQSAMANLVERTTSNDGSFDNIVDQSSCFYLNFPYSIEINGLKLTIENREDLEILEEIIDKILDSQELMQSVEDIRELMEIVFPVTIVLPDYSEVTINSFGELKEYAKKCIEGGDDDDIECIDFVYPITLFTFNANLEQMGSVTVENDGQLRRFFKGLQPGTFASFDYPIQLKLYDGTVIEVHNNAELAAAIEGAMDACDEDDDDDHNDDDFTEERLDNLLMECPWLVNQVRRDNVDQTDQYFEYLMIFDENQKVTVKDRNGNLITGNWQTRKGDNGIVLKMEFDHLVDFNLEWYVYEIEKGKIKLHNGEGNRIRLYMACEKDDPTGPNLEGLREILKECGWIIKKVWNQGEEVRRLLGFEFKFHPEGVVTLGDGDTQSEGTWEVKSNDEGVAVLAITMGNEPGVSFEWPLRHLDDVRLKFEVEEYELILLRKCDGEETDDDISYIKELFSSKEWQIAHFSENGDDTTENYADAIFHVDSNGTLKLKNQNGETLTKGGWFTFRDVAQRLGLILRFEEGSNYASLANDYKIIEVDGNRLELKHVNSNGAYDRLVLEARE